MTTLGPLEEWSNVGRPGQPTNVDISGVGPASSLTPRQWEVLRLLARGRSYSEAAGDLHIELQTLKEHARQIHRRLGVQTTIQAMNVVGMVRL